MYNQITPEHLRTLESIMEIPMDRGDEFSQITDRVERLLDERDRSKMSIIQRLKQLWYGPKERRRIEKYRKEKRQKWQAERRATFIIIALRRHKERTGAWPDTLEQIEPKLPKQMLTDPQNNGPFVFKRDGDDFVFYSNGPNGIDEDGVASKPADDYPIWPLKIKTNLTGKK